MNEAGTVVVQNGQGWLSFRKPVEIVQADHPAEVMPGLKAVEKAVDRGLHAAGFIAYEAAPGLDKALRTSVESPVPLLWFGLYRQCDQQSSQPVQGDGLFSLGEWVPTVSLQAYTEAISKLKRYIESGHTYQVNYTFRLRAPFAGEPRALFNALCKAQQAQFCAYVETDRHVLCSASPEKFFALNGTELVSRPMKGTAPRGLSFQDDAALAEGLRKSEKNRAENIMIVDMIRNDMGRIADTGSVVPRELFVVERYPTVFQMTSTVACTTTAGFAGIMTAMFPCASITGAPKVRTMEIIAELEPEPRGIYTGCIGYVSPGRKAQFNVAIRTVAIDLSAQTAEYGVGGGIVWDSVATDEYAECMTKAAVLTAETPDFDLLETILWEDGTGYFLLDRHLQRLAQSAEYFCRTLYPAEIGKKMADYGRHLPSGNHRIRVRVAKDGKACIDSKPIAAESGTRPRRLRIASSPIDSGNMFLYHKTTNRSVYESALAGADDCDDVILWNKQREITETTIANIVIEKLGRKITPPVRCGLLAGTFREHLLSTGAIHEGVVSQDDLLAARKLFLINSVRKWMEAELAIN